MSEGGLPAAFWRTIAEILEKHYTRMERHMADQFGQLSADVAALTQADTDLKAAVNQALGDISNQVADLKAQIAAGSTSQDLSPQLAALEASVSDLQAVTAQVTSADPGQPAPSPISVPAPSGDGTQTTPGADSPSGAAADTQQNFGN